MRRMPLPIGGGGMLVVIVAVVVLLTDQVEQRGGSETPAAGATEQAEVLRVVDGDTIEVDLDGAVEDVRYIGIDTPESVKPGAPVECFGKEAAELNAELVDGRTVRLVFDAERRDRFGRLLAYVFVGGELVNAELVERGYATTLTIPPNTARADEFADLEREASRDDRGLWGECG